MPNFEDVSSLGKLITFKEMEPDQVVIEYGRFDGVTSNQYGNLYNFTEVESKEKKTLPKCGKFEYLYSQGVLEEGCRYRVIYKGKGLIEKGAWAGKEFNDLIVQKDMDFVPGKQDIVSQKQETTKPQFQEVKDDTASSTISDDDDLLV